MPSGFKPYRYSKRKCLAGKDELTRGELGAVYKAANWFCYFLMTGSALFICVAFAKWVFPEL